MNSAQGGVRGMNQGSYLAAWNVDVVCGAPRRSRIRDIGCHNVLIQGPLNGTDDQIGWKECFRMFWKIIRSMKEKERKERT